MVNGRNHEWESNSEVYTEAQVKAVAEFCGVSIVGETHTHFLALCPFHNNTESPAFAVDKTKGLYHCFNGSCESSGNLHKLLARLKGQNHFEAGRTIAKTQRSVTGTSTDRVAAARHKAPTFVEFPEVPVQRMVDDFWINQRAQDYMAGRGFNPQTLEYFRVGYSKKQDMTIVPMHDPNGMLVGFIGRAIDDKIFKNSTNLPKSLTAWNFHRAKTHGETVIVVESSFDAMRVHQAGYPNVIALLGGHLSDSHVEQIGKTFSTVIIATDFDKRQYRPNCRKCNYRTCVGHRAGRELGHSIVRMLPDKRIKWAAYDDNSVYPHGAKDMGDLTDDEIRQCLRQAVPQFTYARWGIEDADLVVASSA